jgi:alpha-1,2-mannosyltransferase
VKRAFVPRLARLSELTLFGALPLAVFIGLVSARTNFAFDFRQIWQGGRAILDGVSPYPPAATLRALGTNIGPLSIPRLFRFPYPAGSALLMVPLAALPFTAAALVIVVGSTVALPLALWLFDVRDWRCYGVMFGSLSVISAVRLGSLTPLLMLLFALAWRYRDRRVVSGGAIAAAICLKLFPWPLLAWFLATRRFSAAAIATLVALVWTLIAWAVIGFAGFSSYPLLLRRLAAVDAPHGYSLVAFGSLLGLGSTFADALPWLVGAVLIIAVGVAARGGDGDRKGFSLAVAAALLCSPVVWLQYFALLFAVVAVWRKTLSLAWLLPLLFILVPAGWTIHERPGVDTVVGLALATATFLAAWQRPTIADARDRPALPAAERALAQRASGSGLEAG